ncbi:MAG: S1C family serine protease [Bacteroidales bacterium]|nr:S1C family serine protease [Bacteroidales bacterium]
MKIVYLFIFLLLISCEYKNKEQENNSSTKDTSHQVAVKQAMLTSVDIARKTLENTVSLVMQDENRQTLALGSAVILENGKIITNVHVISGAKYGYALKNGSEIKMNISGYLAIDNENDLALLSVPEIQTLQPLELDTIFPEIGENIFAAGNPKGLSGTFSEGIVSSIRQYEGEYLIQISAPISPGSSGGAIVNSKCKLIGIAVGGIENGQNLNFAIPAKYINHLIETRLDKTISLNIPKNNKSNKKEIEKARDLVKIKNIIWYYDSGIFAASNQTDNPLIEFSIYNKTSNPISDVEILIIIYDQEGLPVDYQFIASNYSFGQIMPGLAKKVENIKADYSDYLNWQSGREGIVKVSKKKGYTAEFRVLDYKILND